MLNPDPEMAPKTKKQVRTKRLLKAVQSKPVKSELRRAKILDAAIRIIAKNGVSDLTFERVGKIAGMARSHVIYYYSDRDIL
ncbi:MAG: TetR family transcriptional regulator, partial [Bdellovibrionales bacterium]|nr:TetR family transcriptional regulator [Bdellovibrionales bacterium]